MAVLLSEKEQQIFEYAKEYALTSIRPYAAEWEKGRKLPEEAVKDIAAHGFFGIGCPKELGGKGYNYLETALTYEGLAHGDGGFAFFVQLHNNITWDMVSFYNVSDEVKALLPDMVAGRKLTCYALTEEDAGSDPMRAQSYAVLKEDGYHVFGEKTWASNCMNADYFTTIVKNETGDDMLILLIERNSPGFEAVTDRHRLAGNVMSCGTIKMNDVVVPVSRCMSTDGYRQALRDINVARIFVPAIGIGVASHALDITARYLSKRETFGKAIIRNQAIQFKLAELTAKVEAARWLIYHTASMMDKGEKIVVPSAITKLIGPNTAWEVTTECAQLFGASGFEYNSEISRCVNMARAMKIMDGSTEVQKIVIGRSIAKKYLS